MLTCSLWCSPAGQRAVNQVTPGTTAEMVLEMKCPLKGQVEEGDLPRAVLSSSRPSTWLVGSHCHRDFPCIVRADAARSVRLRVARDRTAEDI